MVRMTDRISYAPCAMMYILSDTSLISHLQIAVGVFGCGYTHVLKSELPPLKTIMDMLKQDPNMFQDQDCIELYIDR